MMDKRRDNKGRVLRTCERQRPDGRYEFRYTDKNGAKKSLYSWKLVPTDKAPSGKRCRESLREIEARVANEHEDNQGSVEITVNDVYEVKMRTKAGIRVSTRDAYNILYNAHIRNGIGNRKIADIKYSDIKGLYVNLISESGLSMKTLKVIDAIIYQVFTFAEREEYIRSNPVKGVAVEVCRELELKPTKKKALTIAEQDTFVKYCVGSEKYRRWAPIVIFMLGTGCRVGETVGLRWEDCDFDRRLIFINHQLLYRSRKVEDEEWRYIAKPKTESGLRVIPMLNAVYDILTKEYERQKKEGFCTDSVDGYTNFIFMNSNGRATCDSNIISAFSSICKDYNKAAREMSAVDGTEPFLLPRITPHTLRHTFCTRLCENETNLKVIQEIMGHKNISITMDIYNEATTDKKVECFENLEGKIHIL